MARCNLVTVVAVVAVLMLYFDKFSLNPPPDMVRFIQLVTITDPITGPTNPPEVRPLVTDPPKTTATRVPLPPRPPRVNASSPKVRGGGADAEEWHRQMPEQQATSRLTTGTSTVVGGATSPVETQPPSPTSSEGPLRFTSKLHMINPLQIFLDYPVAWYLCEPWGFARLPGVTANLVSLIHPIFGLMAGLLIAKSAKGTASAQAELAAVQATEVELRRIHSNGQVQLTPKLGDDDVVSGGGGMSPVGSSDDRLQLEPPAKKGKTYGLPPVDMRMLRLGCVFFMIRNWLDSLDGVVARLQRRYQATNLGATPTAGPTTFGMNGHTVDVITDLTGMLMCSIGIFVFIIRRGPVLSRVPNAILSRFSKLHPRIRSTYFGHLVALGGLVYVSFGSFWWEQSMLKYSNLFDMHSPTNPAIWELEQSFQVRLNQLLWSLSCGDSIFSVMIISMFVNASIWEVIQCLCFIGYLWATFMILYSNYIWHWIILANPAAAAIITDNAVFA